MAKRPNGTGCIYLRGRLWWIKYFRNGKPYHEPSGSDDKKEAERLLKQRGGEIAIGRFRGLGVERITVAELCDLVIADYKHEKKRSLSDVEWRTEKHLRPGLGRIKACEFGARQVKRYVTDRRDAGAADATINRELAIVRRGFTLAVENDPPLVLLAPHIPKLEEDNVREGFLEHGPFLALREKLPIHLKALFVIGYHVGNRLGELRKLQWTQVDLTGREIRLQKAQTKGKKKRTLPIYGEMLAWLEMQKAERDQKWPACPFVFHYNGRRLGSHLKGWAKACEAAGLAGLHFHDLRRSAVRNMERAGIPRKVAMEISGHKTEAVYRRYDIVNHQDMVTAGGKMEAYLDVLTKADQEAKERASGSEQAGEGTVN